MHYIATHIDANIELRVEDSATKLLGIFVDHDASDGSLQISNKPLISSTLQRLGMEDTKSVITPVASGVREELDVDGEPCEGPYSELVGVLPYLASTVRPVISFFVGRLALCCSKLKSSHWVATKMVLRYLKRTKTKGITYRSDVTVDIHGFVNSDFSQYHVARKSTTVTCLNLHLA